MFEITSYVEPYARRLAAMRMVRVTVSLMETQISRWKIHKDDMTLEKRRTDGHTLKRRIQSIRTKSDTCGLTVDGIGSICSSS